MMCKNKRYVLCHICLNLSFHRSKWAKALVYSVIYLLSRVRHLNSFHLCSTIPTTLGCYWQEVFYWSDILSSCYRFDFDLSGRTHSESNSVLWLGFYLKLRTLVEISSRSQSLCASNELFFLVLNKSNISLTSLTRLLDFHVDY